MHFIILVFFAILLVRIVCLQHLTFCGVVSHFQLVNFINILNLQHDEFLGAFLFSLLVSTYLQQSFELL
jgi:hypothetical protein